MNDWLKALPCRIGQIFVAENPDGRIALCHRDDVGREGLSVYEQADAALEIARFDEAGAYRPLKTAPNLRHGWKLVLPQLADAQNALELFYPGRAAAWRAWKRGQLRTTPFRETLGRQSGMYRVAASIAEEQADELIGNFCRSDGGCLRTILWRRDATGTLASTRLPPEKFDPRHDQTGAGEPALPLLCQEACNLPGGGGACRGEGGIAHSLHMILRARSVVTMAGEPIANGAVAVAGNRIVDVGTWPEVRERNAGEVLDLGERVLLPGLINAHCHLDYTDLRGQIPPPSSFTRWIQAIIAHRAAWSDADYVRSIEHGLAEAARFGTTSLVNFESRVDLLAQVTRTPLRTWWCAEMLDLRVPTSASEVYEQLARAVGEREWLGGLGLAPHAPYTASRELYAEAATLAARHNLILSTHLAESPDEMAMFRDGVGELREFLRGLGPELEDSGGSTPLELFAQRGLLNERWLLVHLNELGDTDFRLLRDSPRINVVHCPRSHAYFGHSPFRVTELRELRATVCLGTDSLASNHDLSLFAEMRQFRKMQPGLSSRELLEMVTIHPAAALRQTRALGQISEGYTADMIAVPHLGRSAAVMDETVAFEGTVPWMMIDGQRVAGA